MSLAGLGHRRLAYSPGSQSGVGEIIAARRKKENGLGEQTDALKHIELLAGIHARDSACGVKTTGISIALQSPNPAIAFILRRFQSSAAFLMDDFAPPRRPSSGRVF
jgi:hypothetical protein